MADESLWSSKVEDEEGRETTGGFSDAGVFIAGKGESHTHAHTHTHTTWRLSSSCC